MLALYKTFSTKVISNVNFVLQFPTLNKTFINKVLSNKNRLTKTYTKLNLHIIGLHTILNRYSGLGSIHKNETYYHIL